MTYEILGTGFRSAALFALALVIACTHAAFAGEAVIICPLENSGAARHSYLSRMITDELISHLRRSSACRVVSERDTDLIDSAMRLDGFICEDSRDLCAARMAGAELVAGGTYSVHGNWLKISIALRDVKEPGKILFRKESYLAGVHELREWIADPMARSIASRAKDRPHSTHLRGVQPAVSRPGRGRISEHYAKALLAETAPPAKALDVYRKVINAEPENISAMTRAATLCATRLDRFEDSRAFIEQAAGVFRGEKDESSTDYADFLMASAKLDSASGAMNPSRALSLYARAAHLFESAGWAFAERHAMALAGMGAAYFERGEMARSLECFLKAERRCADAGALRSSVRPDSMISAGSAYSRTGLHEKGVELIRRAMLVLEDMKLERSERYAAALMALGRAYGDHGDYEQGFQFAGQAKRVLIGSGLHNSPAYAEIVLETGDMFAEIHRYQESLNCFVKAGEILDFFGRKRTPMRSMVLRGIGGVYCRMGEYEKAEKSLLESADFLEKNAHTGTQEYVLTMSALGELYGKMEKSEQSLRYSTRARDMLDSNGLGRTDTAGSCLVWIALAHERMKHPCLAVSVLREASGRGVWTIPEQADFAGRYLMHNEKACSGKEAR
jgi:tetratricopeptide (TPR) repeat protein